MDFTITKEKKKKANTLLHIYLNISYVSFASYKNTENKNKALQSKLKGTGIPWFSFPTL